MVLFGVSVVVGLYSCLFVVRFEIGWVALVFVDFVVHYVSFACVFRLCGNCGLRYLLILTLLCGLRMCCFCVFTGYGLCPLGLF